MSLQTNALYFFMTKAFNERLTYQAAKSTSQKKRVVSRPLEGEQRKYTRISVGDNCRKEKEAGTREDKHDI